MIINLEAKTRREALSTYLSLLYRFHKLSDKELEVTVELILTYYTYLDTYESEAAANKLYLEQESREVIRETLGVTDQVFRNYLTSLKKKNVLKEGMVINKVLLPKYIDNKFSVTINITWINETTPKETQS